jgi:antitoxin ParD1/3/4
MIDKFSAISYKLRMAQMNVSLPQGLKSWAEARVSEGLYSSTSDLIRDLLRREQDYVTKLERLQAAIDEGLASTPTGVNIEDIIEQGFARLA